MRVHEVARALASETRLTILELLREPSKRLASQREGDLGEAGACVSLIAATVGISQPTATRHLDILRAAGLITTERIGQRTFHRRNEAGIAEAQVILGQV
ncbi:ArsR/SmtB family transcription factor [Solicola gregarius]|uniref:Helix-turn-helix domain-containing protein n=1 Tax=Solicola gregarius TaxID=2908642 RepID=A0AA46YM69_9ACTN|nr:metalloregulator ArsR/SmtB family transcription factor [Solicola gregarius]UYM06344.1 helix-turn-helix domain-containing protein [Solicola gregarius]